MLKKIENKKIIERFITKIISIFILVSSSDNYKLFIFKFIPTARREVT